VNEVLDECLVFPMSCAHEGGAAIIPFLVDIGTALLKEAHDIQVTILGRDEQGRSPIQHCLVDVGTELTYQAAHHIQMPLLGSDT
jgi:hypothetical protein